MSVSEHEAAARQAQRLSKVHAEQYKPEASAQRTNCSPAKAERNVCWTSLTNPTAGHASDAEHYRKLAAQHRAASEALRAAEASACSSIPADDRDVSPFAHREDIRSVTPLKEEVQMGRSVTTRLAGANVVFGAVPGMTAEWLQRVVDCHLARNAAIGHEAASAEMAYCPLTLRGAEARVKSVGDGFAVTIRAADEETSKEILRRVESLRPRASVGP
jgi:hypothetical protein